MIWLLLLVLVVLLWVGYTVIPELVCHIWHVGTLHHGNRDARAIALTFDDGPDPRYTPQILQILQEHDVHATFFVVGQAAQQHPQLVQQLLADGHELASHAHQHRHAWLLSPVATWRDFAAARRVLMDSLHRHGGTQQVIRHHRPPWGAFNPLVRLACARLGWTPVLWDVRAMDWLAAETPERIVHRIIAAAQPGSIVLCHDAGGEADAPRNTVLALPLLIAQLKSLGFAFVTVDELHDRVAERRRAGRLYAGYPLWRAALIACWRLVELAFERVYRVFTLNAFLRVSPARWRNGDRLHPETGQTVVKNGCGALDIHFQSATLASIPTNDNRALIRSLHTLKANLRDLARLLKYHPDYQHIDVVMAHTLMNRGIELLGFHVELPPPSVAQKWLQTYMRFLMGLYHRDGFRRLRQGSQEMRMKLIWMTRDEVLRLYGEGV